MVSNNSFPFNIPSNKPKLYFIVAKRTFAQNTLVSSLNSDKNHNLRVMSTPEWPVPYWQRAFRHDPVPDEDVYFNIANYAVGINDAHAILAKEYLKSVGKGYVVETIENHADITKYTIGFDDSISFCEAYVDDMLDCIDIAARQNQKILNKYDLSDCLREE